MKRLKDWLGQRVRLDQPGHPDHGKQGKVVSVRRAGIVFVQRATVVWDDGEVSRVPIDHLEAVDA